MIGTSPGSSYVSLKVTAVAAAVALLAVYVGTKGSIAVATTAMTIVLVVFGTYWQGRCKESVFTKGRTLDLG